MRFTHISSLALAAAMLAPAMANAQESEVSRAVQGGGISVPGWTGKIDANEKRFVSGLKKKATKTSPEFDKLYQECMAAR